MYYARFRVNNSGTRMNNGRMMGREKKRNFTIEIVPNVYPLNYLRILLILSPKHPLLFEK